VQRFFRYIQVPDEHMIQTVLGNRPDALGGRASVGTPISRGVDTVDSAGLRAAAAAGGQILFARKFSPEAAPEVAGAIRAGTYETSVLAGA
jgi:hypothetical protein